MQCFSELFSPGPPRAHLLPDAMAVEVNSITVEQWAFLWFIILFPMILAQRVIKHLQWERRAIEKKMFYCEIRIEPNKTHTQQNIARTHFHLGAQSVSTICVPFHHLFFCLSQFFHHSNWWFCAIKQYYLRIQWGKLKRKRKNREREQRKNSGEERALRKCDILLNDSRRI